VQDVARQNTALKIFISRFTDTAVVNTEHFWTHSELSYKSTQTGLC